MKTQILYEDKDMLVCFKPSGLAVQSGRASEPDVVSELKNYLAKSGQNNVSGAKGSARCSLHAEKKPIYLGIIHRLDQPVSGILAFAKNRRAAAELCAQSANHSMQKTYRAAVLVSGAAKAAGTHELTDYLLKEPGGGARIADPAEKEAKEARLKYRFLAQKENRALLEIDLETGRHHQIRVQMAHAGMPLLGDNRYGTQDSRSLSQQLGIRTVQLQAVKLAFTHPATGKKVCFELEEKLEL